MATELHVEMDGEGELRRGGDEVDARLAERS